MLYAEFGYRSTDLARLFYQAKKSIPWWQFKTPEKIAKYIWVSDDELSKYTRKLLTSNKDKNITLEELIIIIQNAYKQVGKHPDKIAWYIWGRNYNYPLACRMRSLLYKK